jgi:hypothetical protein
MSFLASTKTAQSINYVHAYWNWARSRNALWKHQVFFGTNRSEINAMNKQGIPLKVEPENKLGKK